MPGRSESVRTGKRFLPRGAERAVVLLLAALAGTSIADLVHPNRPGLIILVLVPLVAAVLLRPRATATLAVMSTLLALTLPGSLDDAGAVRFVRVIAIGGISLLAVVAAVWRRRLQRVEVDLQAERQAAEHNRREALAVNDTILQDVFAAHTWLELGREREASAALGRALESTRRLVGSLLGPEREPRAGDFVRAEEQPPPAEPDQGNGPRPGQGVSLMSAARIGASSK